MARPDGTVYWQTPVQAQGGGFPDLLMLRAGAVLVAELKAGKSRPTPEQKAWLAAFTKAGVPAYLWTPDDWPEIEKVLA